jgi:hypothetical protein
MMAQLTLPELARHGLAWRCVSMTCDACRLLGEKTPAWLQLQR